MELTQKELDALEWSVVNSEWLLHQHVPAAYQYKSKQAIARRALKKLKGKKK